MPIDPVSAAASGAETSARTRLSDNYDTFLVLLTAQLQNQDPLAPMDSTQFTQQLVQYSQVEQQIRTNEQLEALAAQYQAASAGAALSYLGRGALIESNTTVLAGGEAQWGYLLDTAAENVRIEVRDANGRTVYETAGERTAGDHHFVWNGETTSGATAEDGVYRLVVTATNSDGDAIPATVTILEAIRGVDFSGTTPLVITASGTRELGQIRAVLDGG